MLHLIYAALFVLAHAEGVVELNLYLGVPKDLPLPSRERLEFQQSRKLTKMQRSRTTLRLMPTAVGQATLVIKNENTGAILKQYLINVDDSRLLVIENEIRGSLAEIDGITIQIEGHRVVVDGEVLTARDIARIHSVTKMYGESTVRSLVTLSPNAGGRIARVIEREINNPDIHVRIINGHILLEGNVNNEAERERAETIASAYAPDVVVDEAVADHKVLKLHPN